MNANRREFLRGLGGLTAATALSGCKGLWPCCASRRYAAQLYSINKIVWNDTPRIFADLKAAGYDGVEFAGYGNHSAKELRKMMRDAGLKGAGSHVNGNIALVGDELKRTLDFAAEAGIETLATPHASRNSADEYVKFGVDMGKAAEAAAAYGIKVGIHCTYHHFTTRYGDKTAWDMIFRDASPLLQQEIDTCNAMHVGVDVLKLLRQYPNRHYMMHLKENLPTNTAILGQMPNDGSPMVPWKDVLDYLSTEEVGWYVVEAEALPDSLIPLIKSRQFLETV